MNSRLDQLTPKEPHPTEIEPVVIAQGDRQGLAGQVPPAARAGDPGGPGLVASRTALTVKPDCEGACPMRNGRKLTGGQQSHPGTGTRSSGRPSRAACAEASNPGSPQAAARRCQWCSSSPSYCQRRTSRAASSAGSAARSWQNRTGPVWQRPRPAAAKPWRGWNSAGRPRVPTFRRCASVPRAQITAFMEYRPAGAMMRLSP
jgi:hypothetical protein